MKKILFILFILIRTVAFATHERAGEITYKWVGTNLNDYTYEIIVTTYTKVSGLSQNADRCFLPVSFGDDGKFYNVCRSNYEAGLNDPVTDPWGASCTSAISECGTHHMGEWTIGSPTLQSLDVKKNIYKAIHTYPGPGTYIISMTDPNRNEGIANIPGGQVPFSIQSILIINPLLGALNTSPVLSNPPIDRACANKLFIHNVGASDADGDSLSYKLGVCNLEKNSPIPGYFIPLGVNVDAVTGDFTWASPPTPTGSCSEYNFAIDIEEWRKIGTAYVKIGTTRRDMQVTVCDCKNSPPVISDVKDTCILANTNLTFSVTATDADGGINIFTASGGPFVATPPATFSSNAPVLSPPATGIFSWTPSCNQVRMQPYLVTFKANDDGAPDPIKVMLSDYETFFISVKAPPVVNLKAIPECTTMKLSWNAQQCTSVSNPLVAYNIYRKTGCDTLHPGNCDAGIPASWGYSLIGTVPYTSLTYKDNSGLVHGSMYAYRVVSQYADGSLSITSAPICAKLVRDVPIITNVDVTSTGAGGSVNIKWVLPLPNPSNYDTTAVGNGGPYKLELLHGAGFSSPISPSIVTFSNQYFANLKDSSYSDSPLNTQSNGHTYGLDFFDESNTSCPTQSASSVFLSCAPNDNRITLSWQVNVPWKNYKYDVYKLNGTVWDSLATTALLSFTDTGLINGQQYCYKIKAIGAYPDTTLPSPLINWSQELCCSPIDLTPPCALTLHIDTSCEVGRSILQWNNPNNSCSDDAQFYIIYYKAEVGDDLAVLDTILNIKDTIYTPAVTGSIAGCYAVTAVDSSGNESTLSNVFCVDNCPSYALPNVFTPNGDNLNDLFTPLHPYQYVKDIDIKIYNRWGYEVFRTNNPDILWNGKSAQTKMLCSDGVYYYVCIVNDIRLAGIIPRVLRGNIQLLSK